MNERTNYAGHYSGQQTEQRPQGIVFRFGTRGDARFSPYTWLGYADYQGRQLKLDYGGYDIVVRAAAGYSLAATFESITRHECAEISEKEGELSIEIIEKAEDH